MDPRSSAIAPLSLATLPAQWRGRSSVRDLVIWLVRRRGNDRRSPWYRRRAGRRVITDVQSFKIRYIPIGQSE